MEVNKSEPIPTNRSAMMQIQASYPNVLTREEVKKPNRKSESHAGSTDGTCRLKLLVALNSIGAPVDVANLFFVAPQSQVVDLKLVERVGLVDADQIAAAVGEDG